MEKVEGEDMCRIGGLMDVWGCGNVGMTISFTTKTRGRLHAKSRAGCEDNCKSGAWGITNLIVQHITIRLGKDQFPLAVLVGCSWALYTMEIKHHPRNVLFLAPLFKFCIRAFFHPEILICSVRARSGSTSLGAS